MARKLKRPSEKNMQVRLLNTVPICARKEAKSLLRKTMPSATISDEINDLTLRMRWTHAALYMDAATLDDVREAVTTLDDTVRMRAARPR